MQKVAKWIKILELIAKTLSLVAEATKKLNHNPKIKKKNRMLVIGHQALKLISSIC